MGGLIDLWLPPLDSMWLDEEKMIVSHELTLTNEEMVMIKKNEKFVVQT